MQNNGQPRRWADVAASEQFLSLDPERQERARQLYFDDVVLPRVPAGMEQRARELFDQDTLQLKPPRSGVQTADLGKELAAGALTGTGSVVSGAGDMLTTAGRAIERGARAVLPDQVVDAVRDLPAPSDLLLRPAGQQIAGAGQRVSESKSEGAKQALRDSAPTGDILKPKSWDLGESPSLAGYGLHLANLAGQFVPQAAALAVPGGQARLATMAGVGGLQAGGAAGDEVVERLADMSDQQLQESSERYRELRQAGLEESTARERLLADARAAAFQGAAPVGALGGAMTHVALGPLQRMVGGGMGRRLGYGLLVDAPAEGVQEVAETVAARAATNQAIGEQRDLTENTFGDALLGAMGGAGHAGLGAALGQRDAAREAPSADAIFEDAPDAAGLPAPQREALPAPETVLYGGKDGQVQGVGPNRNVDGVVQPAEQERRWVNSQNDPERLPGGPGLDQQTPRGEPAPMQGQLITGARPAAEMEAREPELIEGEQLLPALPEPETMVVDSEGNARHGPVAPSVTEGRPQGGRGMDQQAPTARLDDQDYEVRLREGGKPFAARADVRLSRLYSDAVKAGEQPKVVRHGSGWAVGVPKAPQRLPMRPIDVAAQEAATSPTNELPAPTEAQIEAGNYKKGKLRVHGLELSIENPRGSERSGKRPDGTEWRHTMSDHYGYIRRTAGADGEQVDVYLGPQDNSDQVFVVDQLNQQDGTFDEHKVMLGYPDQAAAEAAYRSNFDAGWKMGKVTAMPVAEFKQWLKAGDLSKPLAKATVRQAQVPPQQQARDQRRVVSRDRDSVVQAAIRLGGVKTEWRQDTTGDSRGNKNIPGVGALWSDKTGTSIDDMASLLDQHGYVPAGEMERDGGVSWLQAALRDELGGVRTHYAPGSARQEVDLIQREAERFGLREDADLDARLDAAFDLAEDIAELEARRLANEAHMAELDRLFGDDDGRSTEEAGADAASRQPGPGAVRAQGRVDRGSQLSGGRDQGQRGGAGETRDSFALEQQTEQGLIEQAAQQLAAEQAEAQAQRQAEQKTQADRELADFTLKGSDRHADEAAARGQKDLLQDSADEDSLYRKGRGAGVAAAEVAQALANVPELATMKVVQSFDELPKAVRDQARRDGVAPEDVRGIFREQAQYLVADNLLDLEDAIRTATHEMVGHLGVRGLLGDQLDGTMERIYSSEMTRTKGRQRIAQIREFYADPLRNRSAKQQRLLIAQEIVAHLAETGDRPSALQRIAVQIRQFLRRVFPQVPWTYTDVLALIEQSRVWLNAQRGRPSGTEQLYSRRGWSEDFPDTVLAHPLSFLNNHPDYAAAKAGDDVAALRLARDAVTPEFVDQVRAMIPEGSRPSIVPVLAVEGAGNNRIPLMAAEVLALRLGLQTDTAPVQAERVGRTQANALERVANQPTFAGEVAAGDYLILDDTLTQGGTLAQLKTHIEDNGGRVLGAIALTGKNYSRKLALDPSSLAEIRGKYGDIEPWWRDTFGYGFEGLTQSEARTLLTFDKGRLSPEQIRDRVAATRNAGLFRMGQAAAGDRSGPEAPLDSGSDTLYSLRSGRRPHVSDAHPDLNASEQAALLKIGPPTARQRAIDWYRERTDRLMTKIRQGLVDRYAALKELDERLHGRDFLDSAITSSAWVLARMAPAASGSLNAMMHNSRIVFDPEQKVIGARDDGSMGLGEVFSRLGGAAEIERFMGWIAGNRAARLAAEGRENLFGASDIAALKGINRGTTADGRSRATLYDEVFREFQQYRDDVLAIAEATGIISAENRAMWRDEFYVPFYRVMDEEAKTNGPRAGKGLSRQEAYKKLKGGKQKLNDLLENTLMNFHHLLTASLKNQAARQAIDNAEQLGIAQEVQESARDPKTSTFVLKDGEQVFYEIGDPLVFEALTSLADPGLNNFAVRTMARFKRVFTNMTTITPQFILANFLRDSMQAAATTPVSKNVPANMFQGIKAFRDQKTRAQMLASGGAFSFGHIYGADPEEVRAGLRRGLRGAKLVDGPKLVPKLLVAGWDAYNDFANTAENANRAAAFMQNQDEGVLRAAYEARDLMDFSQEGAWPAVRFLIRTVPFLNARLQGLDKLYRAGAKPALLTAFGQGTSGDRQSAARFGVVAGALALASIALYLANHDDEEYRKLEDWQKDSYWFFRIGDQAFFVPKPFEVGAISTLAERMTEQLVDDKASGKLLRDRLWTMVTQTFAFSPVPQAFQPALDVYSNRDAFTGRPIESPGMDRVSPTLRARSTTMAPAHLISEATSVLGSDLTLSPLQADHLIRGYLGQVGAWGAGVVDTLWRTAKGEEEPAKRWHEYQPIRRFYRDLGAPAPYDRYSTLFYEGLKESGRVYADVKRLQELGRLDEARELIGGKRSLLALRKPLGQVQRQLSAINARMDLVRANAWDSERKRSELDRLQVIKSRLTERAGKRIEEVRADD
ncbi:UNVERIFIED_CONTAM: traN [Trichonephila clavipes]